MERVTKRARSDTLQSQAYKKDTTFTVLNDNGAGSAATNKCAQPLVAMVLDVDEGPNGSFHIWARTSEGATALVQVHDYCPYLYVPAPVRVNPDGSLAGRSGDNISGGREGDSSSTPAITAVETEWSAGELEALRSHWNGRLPSECRLTLITSLIIRPIMYYRPTNPDGGPYLRLVLRPGASSKRAGAALEGLMSGREGALLEHQLGMRFIDKAVHEAEVKLLTRFLCDSALSGGAWFHLPAPQPPSPREGPEGTAGGCICSAGAPPPVAAVAAVAAGTSALHYQQHQSLCSVPVSSSSRTSTCDIEVVAPWSGLQSLTPDATQLADPDWCPEIVRQAMACGVHGDTDRSAVSSEAVPKPAPASATLPPSLVAAILAARDGRIAPMTIMTIDVLSVPYDTTNRTPVTSKDDPVLCIGCDVRSYGTVLEPPVGPGPASPSSSRSASRGNRTDREGVCSPGPDRVVFLVTGKDLTHGSPLPRAGLQGAELRCFGSEGEMLQAWKEWLLQVDPDIITTYQVRDTLGAIRDRFERLRLEGGGLLVSRLAPAYGSGSGGGGGAASPMTVKSVVMYSVAWVKRQGRMSSNSNQETFQAEIRGRIVLDVLRQVLTSQSLATFSLVDCCQSLLGETLEVLRPFHLARLAAEAQGRQALPSGPLPELPPTQQQAAAAAARIISYMVRRIDVIVRLTSRLATLPEAFEMARVTGLTIPQVMYNAQMIRTWSLLHRNTHRQNYIIGGRQDSGNLIESPFLMHPIENRTAGLYRTPVATLDFASLYPSLYRAYNLCYTTLVHPDDVEAVGRERCNFTPTGHAFVKHEVRSGILPTILAALMSARAATRAKLKAIQSDPAASAVLDSRQKALKVTANALYGFTGAAASPLQCLPLADSCLAYGSASCRAAIQIISGALEEASAAAAAGVASSTSTLGDAAVDGCGSGGGSNGRNGGGTTLLGPAAAGGRVIYAQTDSVFVHFPRASPEEAVRLGKKAAALVTSSLPYPMELKYEKVMAPFLLLHVNRYAGRAMETEEDAAQSDTRGSLLVKGVRSMWRQSAPFVSEVLQGCLERILMRDDVAAAVSYAEGQIRRLLLGRVELGELAMTGGLWRITGQQVAAAAAAADNDGGGGGGNGGGSGATTSTAPPEDVRGPHVALAVRLSHRDPGRRFVLGERLSYVLLAGARMQDEAAEDPLAAAQRGAAPALELYWRNKLQPPLKELFAVCLPPTALQALLSGQHTRVRVDASLESMSSPGSEMGVGGGNGNGSAGGVAAGGLVAGPGSPQPRKTTTSSSRASGSGGGGEGGFGLAMTPRSPPSAHKTRGGGGGGGGGLQSGLSAFFRQAAKCLACQQALPSSPPHQRHLPAPGATAGGGEVDVAPGLCASCLRETDTLASTYIRLLDSDNEAALQLASSLSVCMHCHAGGRLGAVLCENGECPVLFTRLGAARRLTARGERLERLDASDGGQ